MKRYIDADKMISDTKAMKRVAEGIMIDGIIKYVEDNAMQSVSIACRNCHRTEEISITNQYEYCPHCGAKMDG